MSHSLRTMIDMSLACLVFVAAATAGLLMFQSGAALLDSAYIAGKTQDRSINPTLSPVAGDGAVSGAEVLQSVAQIGGIGAEIVVDGVRYSPSLEREDIAASAIRLSSRYVPSYERGPDGRLQRVVFSSRGGA